MVKVSKVIIIFIFCFSTFSLIGCATRLVDFTMISTKNVDLARGADFKRGQARVEGEDKVSIIIFIPTGTPNIKEAVDRAIEKIPGAVALMDGVITAKGWWIPYIYGESSYVVEGTPLIDPKLLPENLQSNYIVTKTDKSGNIEKMDYVSKEDYNKAKKKLGVN